MTGRTWRINKQKSFITKVDMNTKKEPTNGIYLRLNMCTPNIYTKNNIQKKLVLL